MFNSLEQNIDHFKINVTNNSMKIIPKGIEQNFIIECKEFTVEVPKYFKIFHKKNSIIDQRKLEKYESLILGEHGIPMFRIKNNKIINFYENKNIANNEKIIFAKVPNKEKIQNNDIILGCIHSGMHMCNLPLLKFLFKQNPRIFQNKLFNNQTPFEYVLNPVVKLPYNKVLNLISNGIIKQIITAKENISNDLTPHIPDGLRAIIHSNLWGTEPSLKDLLNMIGLPSNFGYSRLNANAAYYFIIDQSNLTYVCRTFNEDFKIPLINIGVIQEGNRGNKVNLHLY